MLSNALSPCTGDERLITVPAYYGFLHSSGHPRCFLYDGSVFHVLRETSDRSDAGGTTRAAGSDKRMVGGIKGEFSRVIFSS